MRNEIEIPDGVEAEIQKNNPQLRESNKKRKKNNKHFCRPY